MVEAVGKNVTEFKPGEEVFEQGQALSPNTSASGVTEQWFPSQATSVSEQAASVPTALVASSKVCADMGHVKAGQKILDQWCLGGVGTFAVQIAKALGAEVTGVCVNF